MTLSAGTGSLVFSVWVPSDVCSERTRRKTIELKSSAVRTGADQEGRSHGGHDTPWK